ncbi:uncharacterized protein LOC107414068 [Ziziphus jujuba]|uniref:U6 snRNA phosphodiesterase n=2 Tax=Ziziphus jujuba TaxID=326968 RepID=A0A6P3ZHH8_ZIZJJ|nr:uncharacterized protein LOC107414068 [Ziziphus jujuba]KAH7537769.1 hypothetical protein FEM48_Zijuj03G0128000 [Ziziphus jujuba var. spinosa]
MEALIASYGETSSDSDSESPLPPPPASTSSEVFCPLPPPPLSLLNPANSIGALDYFDGGQSSRLRTFPHVEGNYALHVYIPVSIPSAPKKELALFLKKVARVVPGLYAVDVDVPLDALCKDDDKLEQVALERELHISLGRTVPIRLHQIDTVVTMLRQKLQLQRRYWIDFSKWEIFVNDDCTRTFLSMEVVAAGLVEIRKQIQAVNEVYKLHNLPEFYKDPRPHISLAWASGDISNTLKNAIQEERRLSVGGSIQKCFFSCKFNGIVCKIGNKTYKICKFSDK